MLLVERLKCVRGERPLFSNVSLTLAAGEWMHVRGENGAGKTSLLRMVAGLAEPAEGAIHWGGKSIQQVAEQYRRKLFFLGHHDGLKGELTPLENLQLAAAIDGIVLTAPQVLAALQRCGLKGRADLPVRVLSAGQKRRVILARLTLSPAKLWILDEPFTALDVKAVDLLAGLLSTHVAAGGMALLTSHQAMQMPGGKVLQL